MFSGNDAGFFNITLLDDNLLEEIEKFNLTIIESSLPNGIFRGQHIQASVMIVDNDGTL